MWGDPLGSLQAYLGKGELMFPFPKVPPAAGQLLLDTVVTVWLPLCPCCLGSSGLGFKAHWNQCSHDELNRRNNSMHFYRISCSHFFSISGLHLFSACFKKNQPTQKILSSLHLQSTVLGLFLFYYGSPIACINSIIPKGAAAAAKNN